jgi:hypothetical protein
MVNRISFFTSAPGNCLSRFLKAANSAAGRIHARGPSALVQHLAASSICREAA